MIRATGIAKLIALAAFALALLPVAQAQLTTGSITGSVLDPSGASVVGATITVTNVSTNVAQTDASNSAGNCQFLLLPPCTYTLACSSPGFGEPARVTIHEREQLLRCGHPNHEQVH
jgi:hypothetical protein